MEPVERTSSPQEQLVISRDSYRKKFGIAAIATAITALAITLFERHMGAPGGLLLAGAGVSLAGAIYHHKMRTREMKEHHLTDDNNTSCNLFSRR